MEVIAETNVILELTKFESSPSLRERLSTQDRGALRITAITVAEILYGIEGLANAKRSTVLRTAAGDVFTRFADDGPSIEIGAATVLPQIVDRRDRRGTPFSGFAAKIAAICRLHCASWVTRNEKDFSDLGIELINPWLPH